MAKPLPVQMSVEVDVRTPKYHLTQQQILRLVQSIDAAHVEQTRGMSYIAQFQARAELNRIFGFGNWDSEVESMDLLYEKQVLPGDSQYPKSGKAPEYWVTCYKASVRLNVRDYWGNPVCSFVEYHAEENAPLPNRGEAHAMAITSVESYALRRALIGLGDRFGLSLYKKGSLAGIVQIGGILQLDDVESPQALSASTVQQESPPFSTHQPQPDDPMVARMQAGLKVDEEGS